MSPTSCQLLYPTSNICCNLKSLEDYVNRFDGKLRFNCFRIDDMDANLKKAMKAKAKRTITNLEKNNFKATYVDTKKEALTLIKTIVDKDSTTASGGSITLEDCHITDFLKNETCYEKDPRKAYFADYYLASANAVTEHGEIYQVDGRSNRISAILYGPKNVILVVGMNKVVRCIDDAVKRVKQIAAPANAIRLCKETPCAKAGECIEAGCCAEHLSTQGCNSDERICSNFLIMSKQREKGRIVVVLVGEECGY